MQEMLTIFLNWQFILLCVGISCATFVFKSLINFFVLENPKIPVDKHSRIWRALVLPFSPIVFSLLFAVSSMSYAFPYPEILTTWAGRFLFTVCAGMLSPLVYRAISSLLERQAGEVQVLPAAAPVVIVAPAEEENKNDVS